MNHSTILSLLSAWLFATATAHAAPDRVMTIKAGVNGMVCSFCAQGIIAHFKKHPAVSDVHVDLTRKLVLLEEKKGSSISDREITEFIKKSGFDPQKIERVADSFAKVKGAKD
jgi:mercuric ion binding protein